MSAVSSASCLHCSSFWSGLWNSHAVWGHSWQLGGSALRHHYGEERQESLSWPVSLWLPWWHMLFFFPVECQPCVAIGSVHWSIHLRGISSVMFFWVLDLPALRQRWTLNWWSQEKLLCGQVTEIPSAPTLEALGAVHSQDPLALLLALWGKMLSTVFLTVAELMLFHGLLFFEMPAENGINWLLLVLKWFLPSLPGKGLLW